MRISQRSIEAVRDATNITEVASEFTALRRVGARFTGLCPYPDHDEKSPSFSVSPEKGFYHCFGCGRGGDAIKLVMELKPLPFAEAVSYLADRSGIELELEGHSPPARTSRPQARLPTTLRPQSPRRRHRLLPQVSYQVSFSKPRPTLPESPRVQ